MNSEHQLVPIEASTDLMEGLASGPPAAGQEVSPLKKLHAILRGRYKLAIALGLVLALIGGALGFLLPEVYYRSTGIIRVVPVTNPVLSDTGDKDERFYNSFVDSEVARVQSSRVLDKMLASDAWRQLGRPVDKAEIYKNLQVIHPQYSELIYVSFEDQNPAAAQTIAQAIIEAYFEVFREAEEDRRINVLEDKARTLREQEARLRRERERAAQRWGTDDLNLLYDVSFREQTRLGAQLNEVNAALAAAEAVLNKRDPAPAPGGGAAPAPADGAAPAAGDQQDDTAAPATPARVAPGNDIEAADLTESLIATRDQQFQQMVAARDGMQRELKILKIKYRDNHRAVVDVAARLEDMQLGIEDYAAEYRKNYAMGLTNPLNSDELPSTVQQLRQKRDYLKQLHEEATQSAKEIGTARVQLDGLRAEEKAAHDQLVPIEQRIANLALDNKVNSTRLERHSDAIAPLTPSQDRRKVAGVAGVMFGGGLGVGLVMLMGLMDRSLRSVEDAEETFSRVPLLGVLPRLPHDLADPAQAAIASHSVHQVRTLLQIGPSANGRRVFAITSPGPADGKTSLALSLGVSFAASGAKTLLVDCDMFGGGDALTGRINTIIRRKIGQVLQREQLVTHQQIEQALRLAQESNRKLGETLIELGYIERGELEQALTLQEQSPVGLLDALDGEPLENCLADTGIDRLSVLPIGGADPGDVCKVSPAAIGRLLDDARKLFDVVLVDTGPVPGSLEGSHVAAEADGVVLVVSRGEQKDNAARALEHLSAIGARVAGLVFNRAEGRDVEHLAESDGIERSGYRPRTHHGEESSRFGPVARAVAASAPGKNGNGKA